MKKNKNVIYTCIIGNYDDLCQPLVVDDNFDYICFTNDINEDKIGVWKILPIPYICQDKARQSRYVKILPHQVLEEYDWSLWIDANIQIVGKELYQIVIDKITSGGKIFQVNHCIPPRDCIYDEMRFAYTCGKASFVETWKHYCHLKKEKFPNHYGLFENNIILRAHNDSLVREISEGWWVEFCNYSKRDQFSLMYVYWKKKVYPELLLNKNECSRNVSFLSYRLHNNYVAKNNENVLAIRSRFFVAFFRDRISHLFLNY